MQKYYERIIGKKLSLLKFIWVDLLNKCIPLLKSPEVKLILNTLHFQIRRASKCAEFDRMGVGKREKHKLPTLIFSPFLDNRQKFVKEGNVSKKKWGSLTSLNRKILEKLSFWPKVLYLPTNLPPCMCLMNDMVPLRHEFVCAVGMGKNN